MIFLVSHEESKTEKNRKSTLEILFFHNDGINFTANVESITNGVLLPDR